MSALCVSGQAHIHLHSYDMASSLKACSAHQDYSLQGAVAYEAPCQEASFIGAQLQCYVICTNALEHKALWKSQAASGTGHALESDSKEQHACLQ